MKVSWLMQEQKAKSPQATKLEQQIEDRRKKVAVLRGRIDTVAETMFAAFAK